MPGQTLSGPGQAVVSPRVAELNRLHFQHKLNRITVKGQTTILGSCSSRGNLNFTWRLLLAPLPVVDYVIIHELAHLLEMNHTPRFWQVVEGACPEYRRHLAWLRDMSATLYI
ncbi:MAG: M48 family metallopeptidase [Bacillota bacterium]|jgi:predicted metal-dependent hydrolase